VLKSKLERFILKRALFFFILLSLLNIIFMKEKLFILGGLAVGGVFSVLKLGSFAAVLKDYAKRLNNSGKSKSGYIAARYIINQIITITLLAVSLKINLWFFAGMTIGILLVPIVVFINGITESLKITHNNFE
jgi:hypothetical protein